MWNELKTTSSYFTVCSLTTDMQDTAKNWFLEEINMGKKDAYSLNYHWL